ncbi:hypothetical protein [Amycolatopsis magusensis]|uniref:DUF2530 domain-containing protein n=1 Tax=Amycolatopsis magusensis TaxID=882444 RepID=A0ABS4Q126_9PSEU|nr:hypothetical protein [Amycolatopsis magusensis]MBP2185372.1 hypothetical protein [Amycolatopsis magusensis]MDI5977923.1 hypothetical protein [Amycolatopsis magusensis]
MVRCRENGSTLAMTWTLVSVGVAVMLWLSGFHDWPVYLTVAPSLLVSALLWVSVARGKPLPKRKDWHPSRRRDGPKKAW